MASTPEAGDIIANAATDFGGGPLRWTRTGANAASANAVDDYGRWEASLDSFQRLLWSAASATSDFLGAETVSDLTYQYAQENLEELSKYQRESMARGEVELGENFSKWLADTLIIDALPTIITMAGSAASAVLTQGATLPALFAIGSSSVLNLGEIYGESRAEVGKENILPSVVLAATGVNAALDLITPYKVVSKFFPRGVRGFKEKALQELGRNGGWNKLSRLLKEGAKGFNTEAYAEMLQDYNNKVTANIQAGKENPFEIDNDDFKDLLDAYLAGGVLGGAARGGTAFVGTGQAREIIAARDSAEERIGSDLDATVSPLEKELSDIEAKLKKVWPSSKERVTLNAEKRKLQEQIDQAKKDASDKRRKVRTSYTIDDINKIVPIKEEAEAEAEEKAVSSEQERIDSLSPAEKLKEYNQKRDEILTAKLSKEETQSRLDSLGEAYGLPIIQEQPRVDVPSGPTQADVMPDVMPGTPVAPRPGTATAEAAARADQGLAQEGFDPSAALGTPVAPRPGTPTAEAAARADRGLQEEEFQDSLEVGPQGRPRRSFAAIREAIKARDKGPQVMNRPVISTIIGDSENVLVDGDVLITAADIEEAKFAKASRELEDIAMEAESNAFEQAEADGMDYLEAVAAAEAARNSVLQEGGARRIRMYSSRAARLQAQREAAKQRQDREARLNFEAQRRIDEQKKFEKEQAADLKEQAIEMAGETYDAFFYGQISAQEFASRRQREIARIKVGGTAAANAYRKAVPLEKANAILKERGLPTLKPEKDQTTQKDVAPDETIPTPTPEAAPTTTQADATPPVPDIPTETAPVAAEDKEASPATKPVASVIETAHSTETLNDLKGIAKEGLAIGSSTESADKMVYADGTFRIIFDGPVSGEETTRAFAPKDIIIKTSEVIEPKKIKRVEVDVDNLPSPATDDFIDYAEKYLKDKEPGIDLSNATPSEWAKLYNKYPELETELDKFNESQATGEQEINSENYKAVLSDIFGKDVEIVARDDSKADETTAETGKVTTPPDIAVTDVDEDQTQDQQIADMIAREQATVAREAADEQAEAEFQAGTDDTGPTVEDVEVEPGVSTDIETAPTGVDVTGEAVDIPTAPTPAEVVIEEPVTAEPEVLEYAETTINPEGVPIRIYEDPDKPGLNIVESEGVVLKRSKDRAKAVTYANTKVTPETVLRKTPKVKAAPKARPEGKTYTGPKPKGASESLVKWLGSDAPFRATIGKQRASQARKVGIDPDQYTTEEELYDAIVAQAEAQPVEAPEVAPVAEEVQRVAEEIVPETLLERLSREATERRVIENAIMVEKDFTPQEIAEMEQLEAREVESGLMEDVDAEIEAEIAEEEARSEAARATRKLKIESEKVSFETVDNMEVADFLQLARTPRKPGWSKQQLVQIANNIQANDPTVSFDTKKNRADLAQELIAWKESGVTIDDSILEPEYQDDITSDGDFYSAPSDDADVTYGFDNKKSALKDIKVSEEEISNVERSINNNLELMFSKRKAEILKRLKFINMISSSEANSLGIEGDSIASYASGDVKVYFVTERIAKYAKAQNKDADKLTRSLIMHEVGVHAGKNIFSGQEFDLVLDQVVKLYDQKDPTFVNAFNVVSKAYPDLKLFERKFNEEVLAHVIESKAYEMETINKSFFDKLKTAFQKFFEKLFYTVDRYKARADNLTPDVTAEDMFNLIAGHSMRNIYSYALKRHGDSKNFSNVRTRNRDRFIQNSVVKTPMFHAGYYNFSAPVLDKTELGLHVGTEAAALDRVKGDRERLKKGYINIQKPFEFRDAGYFGSPQAFQRELANIGRFASDEKEVREYQKLFSIASKWRIAISKIKSPAEGASPEEIVNYTNEKDKAQRGFMKDIRNALISFGYDSIAYTNKQEDRGSTSYILIKDNQFKDVDSLMFRSGTNVFMDKKVVEQEPDQAVATTKKVEDVAGPQVTYTRKAQGKMFQALKKVQRAIEPLMTIEGYNELETQRMLAKGEIGKWHNYGRVVFDVLYQANAKEKKAILKYFETRGASPDDLPTRKVPVAKLPTVARGTRAKGRMAENRSIRDVAVQAKKEIEQLGANLVRAGLITEEQYKKWQGQYLPKTYLKYIEKDRIARGIGTSRMTYTKVRSAHENFLKDVMEGRIEDPAFLAGRYISMAGADLATINYLQFLAADTGKNGWVLPNQIITYEGMTGTAGYWNEYVNEMRNNISRMRELNPDKAKEMERIADQIQKKLDNVGDMPSAEGYKKVPDNVRYGAMRGLYVKKEIINDVMGLESLYTNNEFLNKALSFSGKATKVFKYTKVPMNIPTQARNIISNVVLMDVSGTNFLRIPGLISRAITDIVQDGKYAQLARKYGIESTTFAAEELVNMDRELLKLKAEKDSWSGMWAKSKIFFNDYLDVGGRAYQKTEVMFKVAKMIDLMENHGKSEAEAARLANEALLDYSNVSQGVRVIRSMPLGSPFITFNLKAGAQMIRNIRNHPIAVAKYAAIPYIISEMLLDNNDDIEEEDIPAMQKLVADYMEGNLTTMILPWKDDEGRLRVFDMGYFLPWGAHLSMAKNLMEGEFGEAAKTPGFFGGPFELVAGIKTNVDPFTGQEIWNESDPPLQQYQDMLGFMASYAMPPMLWPRNKSGDVISNGGQLIKTLMAVGAIDGNIDQDGLPKNTIGSSFLSWLGINTTPLTKETAARKIYFKGKDIKRIQNRLLKLIDDPNISEEDRNRLIDEYRMHQQNALDKYREYSEAFSKVRDVLD